VSLINEALKRTRDAAYESAQTSPPAMSEYRFESEAKPRGPKSMLLAMGISGAGVLAGVIGLAIWVVPRVQSVKDVLSPGKQVPITEARASNPATDPAAAATTQSPVATPSSDAKGTEDQIVARVVERIKAEQPAASGSPQLALQGITYASDNRDAMINGVTVHEGEEIEGARVVAIENRRVTLTRNGQEIILRLP
jgi:Type II secretion system protein B